MTGNKTSEGRPFERRPLIYGRAKGKALSPRQQQLFDDLLPRVAFPIAGKHDPHTVFPGADEVHLEVGFGGGEHLIARAQAAPATGFIGCEPFINGVVKALTGIEEHDLGNVRLHHGDARDALDALADASLDCVDVLYPDPWPKSRHNKRRFIGPDTLASLARAIRPGGTLRIASDIPDYIRWTLVEIRKDGHFQWTAGSKADWKTPPQGWPGTRYEAKAIREGRTPCYLEFIRRP
jgi:tRNA (guanine-N7-)-methyltransferase